MNYRIKDVRFNKREEADKSLKVMRDHIETYGFLTVSDYYDIVGILPEFSDTKWGWKNLDGLLVQSTEYYRKGIVGEKVSMYYIDLPGPGEEVSDDH